MARSSEIAARFTTITGIRTRVIGWYHSHPHITVLPSHVDVRTQALYQLLDEGFVGLIFSVFNHDSASKGQHLQVSGVHQQHG
jgi:BRCA1/BRCA2-containing complex subunit 3